MTAEKAIERAAAIARMLPVSFVRNIEARQIRGKLEKYMGSLISVSDPGSALFGMVTAGLNLLNSPQGQILMADLRAAGKTVGTDLLTFVHKHAIAAPDPPAAPVGGQS